MPVKKVVLSLRDAWRSLLKINGACLALAVYIISLAVYRIDAGASEESYAKS